MKWTSRQPVELRHDDRTFGLARTADGGCQLGTAVVSAALGLGEGRQEPEALGLGELGQRRLLCLQAQPGSPLLRGRDPDVADCVTHIRLP